MRLYTHTSHFDNPMTPRNLSILLVIGILTGGVIYVQNVNLNLFGLNQGFAPEQPLAFSHRLHSGDLQINCLYCHASAAKGPTAGIPASSTCMNCHRFVTAAWDKVKLEEQKAAKEKRAISLIVSPELQKLYNGVGFDTQTMTYQPPKGLPVAWKKVHDLPDFVFFDHSRHVSAAVTCQTCHGPVETMEKVAQSTELSMGWCVSCHRDVNAGIRTDTQGKYASLSCAVCHY